MCLVQLAAGFGAGHHASGSSSTPNPTPCRRRPRSGPWPRRGSAWAGCRSAPASCRPAAAARHRRPCPRLRPSDAGGAQLFDHLAVVRLVEEGADALRHHRADVVHLQQLLHRWRPSRGPAPEVPGQVLGGGLADLADAQGVQEARQRGLLARSSAATRLAALLSAMRSSAAAWPRPACTARAACGSGRRRPAGRPACRPGLRCPSRAGRQSAAGLLALRGAEQAAAAAVVHAAALAQRRAAAHRALPRHAEVGHVGRAGWPGTRPTTSGITSPARRTITVSPTRTPLRRSSNRLCSVALLTVVPPTNTGSSLATGVSLPVRPTWISMSQRGHLLLRRVLVRHRPARLARHEAQALLQFDGVHLVDHAVDVERQRIAPGAHGARGRRPARRHPAPPRGRRTPAGRTPRWRPAWRCAWPAAPALHCRPGRRRRSSAAAARPSPGRAGAPPGRGVARVDEGLLALSRWRSFSARSRRGACRPRRALRAPAVRRPAQPQRDLADGADVLRHVLAGLAVAARGGLHQHALLVAQVDGQAVELQLGGVGDRGASGPGSSSRAPARRRPRARFVVSVSVRMLSIGTAWRTGAKPSSTWPITRCVGESGVRSSGWAPRSPAAPGTGGRTRRRAAPARPARSSGARGGAAGAQFGGAGRRGPQASQLNRRRAAASRRQVARGQRAGRCACSSRRWPEGVQRDRLPRGRRPASRPCRRTACGRRCARPERARPSRGLRHVQAQRAARAHAAAAGSSASAACGSKDSTSTGGAPSSAPAAPAGPAPRRHEAQAPRIAAGSPPTRPRRWRFSVTVSTASSGPAKASSSRARPPRPACPGSRAWRPRRRRRPAPSARTRSTRSR
jgi:hypothetical protein